EPCKHVWATLLAAEAQGYLLGPKGTEPRFLELAESQNALDDYADDDEFAYDPAIDGPRYQYRTNGHSAPRRGQQPNWKQYLAQLKGSAPNGSAFRRDTWPPG